MNWQLPFGAHPLAPFDHQVAGQSSMLRYDETTVCKPLIIREHSVYKTLPDGLKEFTPEYRGEIKVCLAENDGFLLLYGLDLDNGTNDMLCDCTFEEGPNLKNCVEQDESINPDVLGLKIVRAPQDQCMIRVLETESYEVCPPTQGMDHGDVVMAQHPNGLNPWSLMNHKRLLDKLRKSEHSQNSMRFILLKNAVADFKYPCILDLKIGSRLHGDEANPSKVENQTRKCLETTSCTIGVRLCGMQVFQKDTGIYTSCDKFHGRTLTDETFKEALIGFLHNGIRSRTELLQPIVSQLSKLIRCLGNINTYRFYGSSLLIIYDGEETASSYGVIATKDSTQWKNGLNMPQQAVTQQDSTTSSVTHAVCNETSTDSNPDGIRSEAKSSLRPQDVYETEHRDSLSSSQVLSHPCPSQTVSHQKSFCDHSHSEGFNTVTEKLPCKSPSLNDSSSACSSQESFLSETANSCEPQSLLDNVSCIPSVNGKVDVKMIDFAHTTHEGFINDKLRHQGPDMDYINGLTKLEELFKQIISDS